MKHGAWKTGKKENEAYKHIFQMIQNMTYRISM